MKGEIEALIAKIEEDSYGQFGASSVDIDKLVHHARLLNRQLEKALAAICKAYDTLGPAVSDVEIISKVAAPIYKTFGILSDALVKQKDETDAR